MAEHRRGVSQGWPWFRAWVVSFAAGFPILLLLACSEPKTQRVGPELPLRWSCESNSVVMGTGGKAAEWRGLEWPFGETGPEQQAVVLAQRLLQLGDPDGALLALGDWGGLNGSESSRYLKAWALAERARQTCSLPDALEALAHLEDATLVGDREGREAAKLKAALREMTGLDQAETSPWPEVFTAKLLEYRQGFLAGSVSAGEMRDYLRQSLWFSRELSERRFLAEYVESRAAAAGSSGRGAMVGRQWDFLELVALELQGKDSVLRETLDALDDFDFTNTQESTQLVAAFAAFAAGTREYENQALTEAETLLAPAVEVFERHQLPLALWGRFYSAIRLSYDDSAAGLEVFERLAGAAEARGYRALAGRAWWLASTTRMVRNDFDHSVTGYHRAREFLLAAGGADAADFVDVLLAEVESRRGNDVEAWKYRRRAFFEVPGKESLRRRIAMYWEAATALEQGGPGLAAGLLHRQALQLARRWGQPLGVSVALHAEAMWLLDRGQPEAARQCLVEAGTWVEQMEESSLKAERRRSQKSYLGRVFGVINPTLGERLLREGLAEHRLAGRSLELLAETHHLAEVVLRLGNQPEALGLLRQGLEDFEAAYAAAVEPSTRAALLAQARKVGDLLVAELFDRGSFAEALAVAEQLKRHRYERAPAGAACSVMDWLDADGRVWLSSYMTASRTFFWLSRGAEPVAKVAVPTADLTLLLNRIERGSSSAKRADLDPMLGELNRMLGQPLGLHRLADLMYSPDLQTLLVPLGALYDVESGQYLIEGTTIRWIGGYGRSGKQDRQELGSALLIGVSGRDTSRGLGELAKAEAEVEELAKQLGDRAEVMRGAGLRAVEVDAALGRRPDLLHFAGHAVQNRVLPWESYLSLGESEEVLTLGKMREFDLSGLELAVLSACSSLDGLGESKDAAFGLAGALIAGGARSVLASGVRVNDQRAMRYMRRFYRAYLEQGGKDPSQAARTAARELIRQGKTIPGDWMYWNVLESLEAEKTTENCRQGM